MSPGNNGLNMEGHVYSDQQPNSLFGPKYRYRICVWAEIMVRLPSNTFHRREEPLPLGLTPTSFWVMNFLIFGRVEEAEELRLSIRDVPSKHRDPTKPALSGSMINDIQMSPLDLFNPLRVLQGDGLARRDSEETEAMQDFSEVNMSSRSYEQEIEWELSDDDEEANEACGGQDAKEYPFQGRGDDIEEEIVQPLLSIRYAETSCASNSVRDDSIMAYKDLSNRSSLQRKRSEASSLDNEQEGTKSSPQQRSPSRVSFNREVQVVDIPHYDEYSDSLRDRLWNSTRDIRKLVKRNLIEFLADGWDWRSAKEENEFTRLPTGELVHPATWQQRAPVHTPRELSASSIQKRSARTTGRINALAGLNSDSKDRPARRVERRPSS